MSTGPSSVPHRPWEVLIIGHTEPTLLYLDPDWDAERVKAHAVERFGRVAMAVRPPSRTRWDLIRHSDVRPSDSCVKPEPPQVAQGDSWTVQCDGFTITNTDGSSRAQLPDGKTLVWAQRTGEPGSEWALHVTGWVDPDNVKAVADGWRDPADIDVAFVAKASEFDAGGLVHLLATIAVGAHRWAAL